MEGTDEMYLSIRDVAKRLGFAYITVWSWVNNNKIPFTKINGQWRISEKELNQYIKKFPKVKVSA